MMKSVVEVVLILLAVPTLGVATFFPLGLYRLVTRFAGGRGVALSRASRSIADAE
jgi:hypothetical protein